MRSLPEPKEFVETILIDNKDYTNLLIVGYAKDYADRLEINQDDKDRVILDIAESRTLESAIKKFNSLFGEIVKLKIN